MIQRKRKKRARALVEKAELVPVVGETQGKKKKQKLVVRFQKEEAAYEADQEQDEQNSQEEESEENKQGAPLEKQPGPSFATALQKLLKATVPEGEAPILAKYKTPFKKIEQQNKQLKEEATQKKVNAYRKNRGHVIPDYSTANFELGLKKTASNGVAILFNAIAAQQKKITDASNLLEDNINAPQEKVDDFLKLLNQTKSSFATKSTAPPKPIKENITTSADFLEDNFLMDTVGDTWESDEEEN